MTHNFYSTKGACSEKNSAGKQNRLTGSIPGILCPYKTNKSNQNINSLDFCCLHRSENSDEKENSHKPEKENKKEE